MGRRRPAQDLAIATAREWGAEILVLSEPNKKAAKEAGWNIDEEEGTAMVLLTDEPATMGKGKGFTWIKIKDIKICACYASPNSSKVEFKKYLDELSSEGTGRKGDIIYAGDFNAKSQAWGCDRGDYRGRILGEWMASQGCITANEGSEATFTGRGKGSIIDLTIYREGNKMGIRKWRVEETETLSDHKYIVFELGGTEDQDARRWKGRKWDKNNLEKEKFWEIFRKAYDEYKGLLVPVHQSF